MTDRIAGIHAVEMALRMGEGVRLFLPDGGLNARQTALRELALEAGVSVERELPESRVVSQGAILETRTARLRSEKELEGMLATDAENPVYLVLDGVTDPRNLGACLRSAASFGVRGVIVPKDKSAPLNEAAVKTASGAASIVPIFQVTNVARTLEKLKKAGSWIVGTVLDEAAEPLPELDLKGSVTLVMGAEDTGLRAKTRKNCDFLVEIPAPLPDLSLNVSVATGICLYEIIRQRV